MSISVMANSHLNQPYASASPTPQEKGRTCRYAGQAVVTKNNLCSSLFEFGHLGLMELSLWFTESSSYTSNNSGEKEIRRCSTLGR
jgi:hypothetical protein